MDELESKGKDGEFAFAHLCDEWHYEYLQIHQGLDTISSAILAKLRRDQTFWSTFQT
jgi:hypothetical protein